MRFGRQVREVRHRACQFRPDRTRLHQPLAAELQLAFDLLGRKGLVQANAIRAELAKAVPYFAGLALEPQQTLHPASV